MTGTPRQHHYVPQFYLRGFASEPGPDAKLVVFDSMRHRRYVSSVRNLAVERDFNRFDDEGIAPDIVESRQARFEADIASLLSRTVRDQVVPDGPERLALMKWIALLMLRNPVSRKDRNDAAREFGSTLMRRLASSRERWERHAAAAGTTLTYDDIRGVLDRGGGPVLRYTREGLLRQEEEMAVFAVPILARRHWCVLSAEAAAGDFCTSDNPARLQWTDLDRMSRGQPLGIGTAETSLWLPLSRRVALIGTFEAAPTRHSADDALVAAVNAMTVAQAPGRTFCGGAFRIFDVDREIRDFEGSLVWQLTGPLTHRNGEADGV